MKYEVEVNQSGEYWKHNGLLHRENGPAVIDINGAKAWYKNGRLHREDGPAFEAYDGLKVWYFEGHKHREDGPAIVYPNGSALYFWMDEPVSREKHREKRYGKRMTLTEIEKELGYKVELFL